MAFDLKEFSEGLAAVVRTSGQGVVQVDARRRYPASGIVWSEDGVIVTANHVVRADGPVVVLSGGDRLEAEVAGRDPATDLALLRVERDCPAAIAWTPEGELSVGDLVLALGRPGQTVQASLGILSALGGPWRVHGGAQLAHFVRPDLVMYPGFSGGPILAADGRIVGMATSALAREGAVALTRSTVAPLVSDLLRHGTVRRAHLGVGVQTVRLPAGLEEQLGQETGVLLNSVEPGSPAEGGGLVVGDILVLLDGQGIQDAGDLAAALRGYSADSEARLLIVRGGEALKLSMELGGSEE